jgi:hypothetical protein
MDCQKKEESATQKLDESLTVATSATPAELKANQVSPLKSITTEITTKSPIKDQIEPKNGVTHTNGSNGSNGVVSKIVSTYCLKLAVKDNDSNQSDKSIHSFYPLMIGKNLIGRSTDCQVQIVHKVVLKLLK